MSENINVTPGSGAVIAAENIGGILVQRIKMAVGDSDIDGGDVSSNNPMPIKGSLTGALPSGSNTIGAVTQASGPWTTNLVDVNGAPLSFGQALMAASLPVTIASNQSILSTSVSSMPSDVGLGTINITQLDTASTPTTQANGQIIWTGSPTSGSAAAFSLSSAETVEFMVSGTWTGGLQVEVSPDGGTTWAQRSVQLTGTNFFNSVFSANFIGAVNVAGRSAVRVRSVGSFSGTATILARSSLNPGVNYIANGGGQYNSALPALVSGQSSILQVDSSGRLLVGNVNTVSTVSTVTSVTNVGSVTSITNALPSGTNLLGDIEISSSHTHLVGTHALIFPFGSLAATIGGSPIFTDDVS